MLPDELFDEVMVVPRAGYVPVTGLRVIERPGWHQVITPSGPRGLNTVALAVLAPGEADQVIDATVAGYRALGVPFRWRVDRQSAPADLGARLAQRGLVPREVIGMARAITDADRAPPPTPDIAVERIDLASEPRFTAVMAAGWEGEPAALAQVHRCALADPTGRHELYLARFRGEPAATAGSVMFARSAYLVGGVVLPAFRGVGLYRALVAARIAAAASAGRVLATCQARASSAAPVLARLGFRQVARLMSYEG